jgi:hypothetical protein
MPTGTYRKAWAIGAVLAMALAVGGCGDDKKDASPSASPTYGSPVTAGPTSLTADQLPEAVKSAAAAAGAKSDASGAKASKAAGALIEQPSQFVSFAEGDWFLSESIKPTANSLKAVRADDASLDWTSTYEEPNTEQTMVLSGHLRGLAAETTVLKSVVKKSGAKVIEGDIGGKKAAWADVAGGNVVMLIALNPTYTLKVETSGVDLNASLALAKKIAPSTQAKWTAAGGKTADCQPGDECAAVPE